MYHPTLAIINPITAVFNTVHRPTVYKIEENYLSVNSYSCIDYNNQRTQIVFKNQKEGETYSLKI